LSWFTALRDNPWRGPPPGDRSDGATRVVEVDLGEWRRFCGEVAAAADLLANTARRAEGAACAADLSNSPGVRAVRGFALGSMLPNPDAQITTYATTMLGTFAALEALRRRLVVHD
jgi:hypothetical protein